MLVEGFQPDWAEYDNNAITPTSLAVRTKLHHIQSSAICKIVAHLMATPEDRSLEALIDIFDSQARMMLSQLHDEMGEQNKFKSTTRWPDAVTDILTQNCVRLHICVSRFMQYDSASTIGLVDVYGIALRLIEKFSALNASTNIASHSTFYLYRSLGLAAFVILRLCRSPVELVIDRERGKRCYFIAIQLLRTRIVEEVDLDSKLATILTDLWSSSLVFRTREGVVDSLLVRVKSRLVSPRHVFQDDHSKNAHRR